jgi:hypothetical protein
MDDTKTFVERRSSRSETVPEALAHQLEASATRAGFSTLVLAEQDGFVVARAGSGADPVALAALAPEIASGCELWHGRLPLEGEEQLVTIASVCSPNGRLVLSAVGGRRKAIVTELRQSGEGVCRILA